MEFRYDNRLEYDLKEACKEYNFLALNGFWKESNKNLLSCWNGVGAEGDWINPFIPETVYGLNISLASLVHDWMFLKCKTKEEFHLANLYFLHNMNQIVREESYEFMKTLRFLRTNKYYIGVESPVGLEAFRKGKGLVINSS